MNRELVLELIQNFSGQANILTIPRFFIDLCDGDIKSALFLSQCLYWSDRTNDPEGWFWKSKKEWGDELGLSPYEVDKAREKLHQFIETKTKKVKGSPTLHYRVKYDAFIKNFNKPLSKNNRLDSEKSEQSSLTEITSKINAGSDKREENKIIMKRKAEGGDLPDNAVEFWLGFGQDKNPIDKAVMEFPPNVREVIELFLTLWNNINPPRKKDRDFSLWCSGAREFVKACGNQRWPDVMKYIYKKWEKEGHPFYVFSPQSIVSSARIQIEEVREEGRDFIQVPEDWNKDNE